MPNPLPKETEGSSANLESVVTVFTGLAYALSARAMLLLSLVFSFILAVMAMHQQTMFSLYVLISGSVFSILPVAYLEVTRRAA